MEIKGKSDLEERMEEREQTEFRSRVGQLNWMSQTTRPDMSRQVSQLGQSFHGGRRKEIGRLNKVIEMVKEKPLKVKIEKIDKGSKYLEVYVDAAFGREGEQRAQVGILIMMRDKKGRKIPLWKSQLSKRVARTTMEAETLALADGLEWGLFLSKLYEEITGEELEIVTKTDSKTLESALKSGNGVKSRRLRIDVAAIQEMI